MRRSLLFLFIIYINVLPLSAQNYVETEARSGDGYFTLLKRFDLPSNDNYLAKFRELNNLAPREGLRLGRKYQLPIRIYEYNGRSIRSTIGITDFEQAKGIQDYNLRMMRKGLKSGDYRRDKILWVPMFSVSKAKLENTTYPIFGKRLEKVNQIDNQLRGNVYYLVSGHGGPDPGAIGFKAGHELHEDEYAYDVTLRLARRLLEHGATVYILIQDPDDGIRADAYLPHDSHEVNMDGTAISTDQVTRLRARADLINKYYAMHEATAHSQQTIVVHLDSRSNNKRIDIFFYHNPGSAAGKSLAMTLLTTIEEKYADAQPGRGYHGTVNERNLFMLRETRPTAVYIELGNIRNPRDQIRFIEKNNRQAVANWLCEGLIRAASE
ncbi:MAG: N-acetylmuramoyl-L-alanine amidase [Candidatus Kapaibacterium sp.]